MLAQILKDMWVDPDVLEALCEEQRRTLFLKMREEQVRRWREREETDERGASDKDPARPDKDPSKRVSWLPGRDGDVCVHVIGEEDDFRSSNLLKTLRNNRIQSKDGIQTEIQSMSLLTNKEIHQPAIPLHLTDDSLIRRHGGTSRDSEEDQDSGSAEDDPREDSSDSDAGVNAEDPKHWGLVYRTHRRDSGPPPLSCQLSVTDQAPPQDRVLAHHEQQESSGYGGRVAQLRRAFAGSSKNSLPVSAKPPVPLKPHHLLVKTNSLR
ncbi:SH2 domain-containing protein 4A [Hypomesus transpacificus]|uniref:SH2 domain-containing protein 4A n=1 Tax=Hypomesus transpacificus TaxID=137520 RepID=UPI001F0786F6|nr:SH2 domain-containing protein 4A [Hypomesus transpacificus]